MPREDTGYALPRTLTEASELRAELVELLVDAVLLAVPPHAVVGAPTATGLNLLQRP